MGELRRDWLRGVGVTVPVTGGGGNNQAWPLCVCTLGGWGWGTPVSRASRLSLVQLKIVCVLWHCACLRVLQCGRLGGNGHRCARGTGCSVQGSAEEHRHRVCVRVKSYPAKCALWHAHSAHTGSNTTYAHSTHHAGTPHAISCMAYDRYPF